MRYRTYFVYIMSSLSRTLYTGVTNHLERRGLEHKEGRRGSISARYNVNRLVYFEAGLCHSRAWLPREESRKRRRGTLRGSHARVTKRGSWDLSVKWQEPTPESGIPRAAATRGNDKSAKPA